MRTEPDPAAARTQPDLIAALDWFVHRWQLSTAPETGRIRGTLTQSRLAKMMRVSPQSLSAYRRGTRKLTLDAFHQALQSLDVPAATIEKWLRAWRSVAERDYLPQVVPRQLPLAVSGFIGREHDLEALALTLGERSSTVVISAIAGTAGVGKTTLAVRWAHQVRHRFPDGDLYVDMRGFDPVEKPLSAANVLGEFLRDLGVRDQDIRPRLDGRVRQYRTALAGKRVLILLDNAATADQVEPLLPGTPGCLVIVTSRNEMPGLIARTGARRLALDLLAPDEASDLLRTIISDARADEEPAALARMARMCCYLPLALRVAGAHAATSKSTLTDLVRRLGEQQLDFFDAGDLVNVRAVLSWSYRALSEPNARLFRLLGLHAGPGISTDAAAALAAVSAQEANAALTALAAAHLVEEHRHSHTHSPAHWRMHDLLRAYAAEQCTPAERAAAFPRLFDWYLDHAQDADTVVIGNGEPSGLFADRAAAIDWLETERPNLMATVHRAHVEGFSERFRQLAGSVIAFLDLRRYWSEWADIAEAALADAHDRGDLRLKAWLLNQLGYIYSDQRDNQRAIDAFEQALAADHVHDDPDIQVTALTGLCIVHRFTGQCTEAIEFGHKGLAIARRTGLRAKESRLLQNMGAAYGRLHRHDEQLSVLQQALAIRCDLGHRDGEADSRTQLAAVHAVFGQHDAAIGQATQAAALWAQSGHDVGEARALIELAQSLLALERFPEALQTVRRAVGLAHDRGHDHTEAEGVTLLGEILHKTGDHRSAVDHLEIAVTLYAKAEDKPSLAHALYLLGVAHGQLGEHADARRSWRKSLDLYNAIDSPVADVVSALLESAS